MIGCGVLASRRSECLRAALMSLCLVAGAGSACTTNHDALARQPKAGSSNGGGGVTAFLTLVRIQSRDSPRLSGSPDGRDGCG